MKYAVSFLCMSVLFCWKLRAQAELIHFQWEETDFKSDPLPEPQYKPIYMPRVDDFREEGETNYPSTLQPKVIHSPYRMESAVNPSTNTEIPLIYPHERARLNRKTSCHFFGKNFPLYFDARMNVYLGSRMNESGIRRAWRQLENSQYDLLIKQLRRQARNMRLNDWGYALLIHETAKGIFAGDNNARQLFEFFMIDKSGYGARLGLDRGKLYLMLASEQTLFGATYFRKDAGKFYVVDLNGDLPQLEEARVLELGRQTNRRKFNLELNEAPLFPARTVQRDLRFYYQGDTHHFSVSLNRNLLDFYRQYPFTDLHIKFGAPLSVGAQRALLPGLNKLIAGMAETEAVNLLLRFVQTAFPYQTDGEQFGQETYLFAEQTLYYPYSDCEDRSVLFAYLVKELLGLETIGLVFPGHVATAVRFNENASGSYINYQGERYYLCDPTYMYATYGMVMPEVANESVKVVLF